HCSAIFRPVSVEPVNEISRTSLWPTRAAPASPNPFTTFTTPFGMPAFSQDLTRLIVESGTSSPDLITTVFPQTSAGISFHEGIAIGKLKGVIKPHIPTGWRTHIANLFGISAGVVNPWRRRPSPAVRSEEHTSE